MTQQSNESPQTPARLNSLWLAGIVVIMLGLGYTAVGTSNGIGPS